MRLGDVAPAAISYYEAQADLLPAQEGVTMSRTEGITLSQTTGYQPSFGIGPGTHYRKERGDGCYHLRVYANYATLHWDRFDPRRFPVAHFFETPQLWGGTLAAGLASVALVKVYHQLFD